MSISATAVKDGIINGLKISGEAIKDASFWMGRTIKTGAVEFGKLVSKCWDWALPQIKAGASSFAAFMKTPYGWGPAGLIAGLGIGYSLEKLSENAGKAWEKTALKLASVASYAGGGAAIAVAVTLLVI